MTDRAELHLVGAQTGETQSSAYSGLTFNQLVEVLERKERELIGYRLRLGAKEKELERLEGVAPGAEHVQAVGGYWQDRALEEGWWSRRPAFRPGHPRWSSVAARLLEPDYDVEYCFDVIEGALSQPKQATKREWVDAKSIFGAGNIESHYERAQDPYCQNVKQTRRVVPDAARQLLNCPSLESLVERCGCGHMRLEHSKGDPARHGCQPCLAAGCGCEDFDDFEVLAEAWKRRQAA